MCTQLQVCVTVIELLNSNLHSYALLTIIDLLKHFVLYVSISLSDTNKSKKTCLG